MWNNCCGRRHEEPMCKKICKMVKLITLGVVLGSIAGTVAMYIVNNNRWIRFKSRQLLKNAQDFTKNVGDKIMHPDDEE